MLLILIARAAFLGFGYSRLNNTIGRDRDPSPGTVAQPELWSGRPERCDVILQDSLGGLTPGAPLFQKSTCSWSTSFWNPLPHFPFPIWYIGWLVGPWLLLRGPIDYFVGPLPGCVSRSEPRVPNIFVCCRSSPRADWAGLRMCGTVYLQAFATSAI